VVTARLFQVGADPVDPSRRHEDKCPARELDLRTDYPLDRLSRYEAVLWREACQILGALDALDRRKPQDRSRRVPDW
jgi:hypothetical protein